MRIYKSIEYRWNQWQRQLHAPSPILVNSIPKSGTNLLKSIILALPYTQLKTNMSLLHETYDANERLSLIQNTMNKLSKGDVYTGHIPFSDAIATWLTQQGIKHLLIYRDPRAVAVSGYHYLKKFKKSNNRGRMYFELFELFDNESERLLAYIQGIGRGKSEYYFSDKSIPNIALIFQVYLAWLERKDVFAVKYEDFIGDAFTSNERSIETTQRLIDFLGLTSYVDAEQIFKKGQNPANSPTFREGSSSGWRKEFRSEHFEAFDRVAGDLLDKLGYER